MNWCDDLRSIIEDLRKMADAVSVFVQLEGWAAGHVSDETVGHALGMDTFAEIVLAAALSGVRLGGRVRLRLHVNEQLRADVMRAMLQGGFSHAGVVRVLGPEAPARRRLQA